jgi:hypothetical protein
MILPRAAMVLCVLLLAACDEKQPDPSIDVCQVNIDCTLVQLDQCCARTNCDSDLHAETSARTRHRLEQCARKDCASSEKACKTSGVKVGSFCRDGKCVVEAVP